ncbi:MAG: hypothetical protein FWG34_11295 [Oscillospiraceae bacterium]|nr:hypothetical protein [Oscillospiraceae bacterium]
MSVMKERILGAITVMSEEDAERIWEIIKMQFGFPTDIPTEEETAIINAYKENHEDYQPYITHENLKKELNLG